VPGNLPRPLSEPPPALAEPLAEMAARGAGRGGVRLRSTIVSRSGLLRGHG
jgi:hypothetical protein